MMTLGYVFFIFLFPREWIAGNMVSLEIEIWIYPLSKTFPTGKTQRDRVEREVRGGIGMGDTCISKADSCQCMTKITTIL